MKTTSQGLLFVLAASLTSAADLDPIPLTPESYNADVVVERTAPGPVGRVTTASMDGGTNNTGRTFYEIGYNPTNATTGIPAPGTPFTHQTFADHSYTMADYTAPNAILITPPTGFATNGTFTLVAPAAFSSLSLLAAGGNGGVVVAYTIHYDDSSTETGTLTIVDWFNGANPAWTANGRFNLNNNSFDNLGAGNPRLYGFDIALANTVSLVTSIDFVYSSGTGRDGLFALSGSPPGGGPWTPIAITGYAYDMIIEAGAPQTVPYMPPATTVSMDGGTANTGNTWYKRGFDPFNPTTGLPLAGSILTSAVLPDHHYLMPASYAAPNAIYVDATLTTANITLANPSNYSALSFLNATANGNVTVQCTMQYEDGSSEVNTFLAKDWFNNTPVAYTANGRFNLNNSSLADLKSGNPRLYEAEFVLGNTLSRITNVVMQWLSGGANSRVVVLAVSATAGALKPIFGLQPSPVNTSEGMNVGFNVAFSGGSQPITVQWQRGTNGVFVNLVDAGSISGSTTTNLAIMGVTVSDIADYRIVASNVAGSVTSIVAGLTVLSSLPDVTAPTDVITAFGGTSPAGEEVLHAIDNMTQKYLNFGANGGAPFVGPVGFVVTPAMGATVVKAVRIYTANDAEERDPADFILEGSNDGGATYSLISSNALALPTGRNPGGAIALDPLTQFLQQVILTNPNAYTTYRFTVTQVKNAANSMQLAEVELLGTPAPLLTIERGPADDEVTLRANMDGTLQATTELRSNPQDTVWQNVGPIGPSTPVTLPVEPLKFFRSPFRDQAGPIRQA